LTQQFEHSGGAIAANIDEGTDVEPVQRCEDIGACTRIWFVAGRAER
jgi:hypothetical protein